MRVETIGQDWPSTPFCEYEGGFSTVSSGPLSGAGKAPEVDRHLSLSAVLAPFPVPFPVPFAALEYHRPSLFPLSIQQLLATPNLSAQHKQLEYLAAYLAVFLALVLAGGIPGPLASAA